MVNINSGKNNPAKRLDVRKKKSEKMKGENNYMFGKWYYDIWVEKYGQEEANKRLNKTREKISMKSRKNRIKEIEEKYGQCMPNYNPKGCKIIEEYGKENGFNFQHAENGGEVCIDGYYPDGLDEERKTIIEVDEKYHFNLDGTLKKKDIQRQKCLEELGYKIIRIKI